MADEDKQASGPGDEYYEGELDPLKRDSAAASADELEDDETGGGLYNAGGDDDEADDDDDSEDDNEADDDLYNEDDPADRKTRFKSRVKQLAKNKFVIGGAIGGAGTIVIIIILIAILGSLKLPDVMQNIETWEFARVTRQFADRVNAVSDQSTALAATDDPTWSRIKAAATDKYSRLTQPVSDKYNTVRDSTWGKLDRVRPDKIINNLGENNGLKLNYTSSNLPGRSAYLTGIELDGVKYDIKPITGASRYVPGFRSILEAQNKAALYKQVKPALSEALKTTETGPIMRSITAFSLRRRIGAGLTGWVLDKFKGKTDDQARLEETRQNVAAVDDATNKINTKANTSNVNDAIDDVEKAQQEVVGNDSELKAAIDNGGDSPVIDKAGSSSIGSDLTADSASTATRSVINPFYDVIMPLCIIEEGSIQKSGPVMEKKMDQAQDQYFHDAAAAHQVKTGSQAGGNDDALAKANAAAAASLGPIETGNSEAQAAGGTANTTLNPSAESGAGGSYTYSAINAIFSVIPGISATGLTSDIINGAIDHSCPVVTSPEFTIAAGAGSLFAAIGTLGGSEVAAGTAGQGARIFIKNVATNLVKKFASQAVEQDGIKTIKRSALDRAQRFAFKQGIIIGGTYGLTEVANLVVSDRAGNTYSGLSQQKDRVQNDREGADIASGEINRGQLFGRALTPSEVKQSDDADKNFVAQVNASKSFTDRYFATSNSFSLVSSLALSLDAPLHSNLIAGIEHLGLSILKPVGSLGSLLSLTGIAHADSPLTGVQQHNGDVQFGWSEDEEKFILAHPSFYNVDQNRAILDDSGKERQIASDLAICFGYKYTGTVDDTPDPYMDPTSGNTDMVHDDSGNTSALIAAGQDGIPRDDNASVINGGKCSPDKLGLSATSYDDASHDKLVIRWRLAMSNDTALDQELGIQDPTTAPSTTDSSSSQTTDTGTGGQGISADGFVFPEQTTKTKIKAGSSLNGGSPLVWCFTSQTNCHHDYNAADIFDPTGTPVLAVRDGSIVYEVNGQSGGTGSFVILKTDPDSTGKSYIYYYGHLLAGSVSVLSNQKVKAGDKLGEIGTAADAEGTSPHLHIDAQLSPPATTREGCTNAACAQAPFNFINLQPTLVAAYNNLPD